MSSTTNAIIAGLISAVIGIIATYIIAAIYPPDDLTWAVVAVGISSFFGGLASYLAAAKDDRRDTTTTTAVR